MEDWLQHQYSNNNNLRLHQNIPYERIQAQQGDDDVCIPTKSQFKGQCRGISGLIYSNLKIMKEYNTTGITLVLEDDYIIQDLYLLERILQFMFLEEYWDTIRINCWGIKDAIRDGRVTVVKSYGNIQLIHVMPKHVTTSKRFFGGTHATLWNHDAVPKLQALWNARPYDELDVRLWNVSSPSMKNYCLQIGDDDFAYSKTTFNSTIPKEV